MMTRALLLLLASLVGAPAGAAEAQLKAGVFTPARMAPEFTLAGSDGSELTLSRFRGKVVLLGFGFTSCREVCPVTLATLAAAQKQLGAQAGEVQVVYTRSTPSATTPSACAST